MKRFSRRDVLLHVRIFAVFVVCGLCALSASAGFSFWPSIISSASGSKATLTQASAETGPQSLTNVQKLSQDPATTNPGKQVSVSDGFDVGGAGTVEVNLFFVGASGDPKTSWFSTDFVYQVRWAANHWEVMGPGDPIYASDDDVDYPWQVTTWSETAHSSGGTLPLPTLTHPAIQEYQAASTAQGGVFNDAIGVCAKLPDQVGGKDAFALLGGTDPTATGGVQWGTDRFKFYTSDGTYTYYSLSAVLTPDLASNWKNASDDSPASITVTSKTQGALVAGFVMSGCNIPDTNDTYVVNGSANGRPSYLGLVHGKVIAWDGSAWKTDGDEPSSVTNTAIPVGATFTHQATITISNVAAEINWTAP